MQWGQLAQLAGSPARDPTRVPAVWTFLDRHRRSRPGRTATYHRRPDGIRQHRSTEGSTKVSKSTTASVESALSSALFGYKDSAAAVKAAHHVTRQAIKEDPMISDLAKQEKLDALAKDTRSKLDAIRAQQDSYIAGLKSTVEKELRGNQPADANSVLLRRDASDRVRKITDKHEAMDVLNDAIHNGDAEMAHAIGTRARNSRWLDVADVYKAAHPDTADSAAALTHVEATTSGGAFNLSNSMTYAAPLD